MTPAIPRKAKQQPNPLSSATSSVLDDLSALVEGDLFAKQTKSQIFKPTKLSLNDLCIHSSMSNTSVNPIQSSSRLNIESELLAVLPEKISYDPKTVQLANVPPTTMLNKQNIIILLYSCIPQQQQSCTTRCFIVTILNTNVEALRCLRLTITTTNKKALVRLEDKGELVLSAVSPNAPIATVYLMLCVLLLDDIHEIDLDFSVSYVQQYEKSITGNIIIQV
ncbi:hypothetical protein DICVIV_13958 [Dictyocaulus viviparus]|uniref:GAE domain-containing protein n=1 Tax=Dictyocaulus viviparus TaxID=29172 RepID=A0A0D8X900_DICVI|nr:hypothetical protein DICVIV_13958 [Dictyocaulus viviparus]